MLTNERLKEVAEVHPLDWTEVARTGEIQEMARELLTLRSMRDAVDEEVDSLYAMIVRLGIYATSMNERQESVDYTVGLRDIARGQQLREAREETERMKKRVEAENGFAIKAGKMIDELTAERDEARKELTALRSAPGMEEVDVLVREYENNYTRGVKLRCITDIADIARRAIASREEQKKRADTNMFQAEQERGEAVGLLKWLDEFWDFKKVKKCLREYASDKDYGDDQQKARLILEIVEGK